MGLMFEPMGKGPATRAASLAADIQDLAEGLIAELDNAEDRRQVYEQIHALRRTLYGLEMEVREGETSATISDAC
jgi:hypothetical protein